MLMPTTKKTPVSSLTLYLVLALRFVAPYTLPIGALSAFTVAGFLASTIIGLCVLGVCLILMQLFIELGSKQ